AAPVPMRRRQRKRPPEWTRGPAPRVSSGGATASVRGPAATDRGPIFSCARVSQSIPNGASAKITSIEMSRSTANDTLFAVLDAALTDARVRFVLPDRTYEVGKGSADPAFIVRVTDAQFARRVLTSGNLGLGETYMEGGWSMERGTLDRFI